MLVATNYGVFATSTVVATGNQCDGQKTNSPTCNVGSCNAATQYKSEIASSGCGLLFQYPCYSCCVREDNLPPPCSGSGTCSFGKAGVYDCSTAASDVAFA